MFNANGKDIHSVDQINIFLTCDKLDLTIKRQPLPKEIEGLIGLLSQINYLALHICHTPPGIPAGDADCDLNYLARVPFLKELELAYAFGQKDFCFLRELKNLERLEISGVGKKVPLNYLIDLPLLRSLTIEKMAVKFESLKQIKDLEELSLQMVTLKDFSCLADHPKLRQLSLTSIKSGSFEELTTLKLKRLKLWSLTGVSEINFLSEISDLEELAILDMGNIKQIPKLKSLKKLKVMTLRGLKNVTSLAFLEGVKSLETLWISDASHMDTRSFEVLQNLPNLKFGSIYLNENKNIEVEKYIKLKNPLVR